MSKDRKPSAPEWFERHNGPSDSGVQEHTPGKSRGGGAGSLNQETGRIHYTDYDGAGSRISWDEGRDGIVDYHRTPRRSR